MLVTMNGEAFISHCYVALDSDGDKTSLSVVRDPAKKASWNRYITYSVCERTMRVNLEVVSTKMR